MSINFTDAQYLTARQKTLINNQWTKLLESDFDKAVWDRSKPLYRFLTMYCGHIAHFNEDGFYAAQMGTPGSQAGFLKHMAEALRKLAEGHSPAYQDKADIGAAMLLTLTAHQARLSGMITMNALTQLRQQRAAIDAEIARLTGADVR